MPEYNNIFQWLAAINAFIGLFAPTPEGSRRRYLRRLQKQLRKGEITQDEYDQFLKDYDNPIT